MSKEKLSEKQLQEVKDLKKIIKSVSKDDVDSMGNKIDHRKNYMTCPTHGEHTECKKYGKKYRCVHCGKDMNGERWNNI